MQSIYLYLHSHWGHVCALAPASASSLNIQGCLPGKHCCGVVTARISLGFLILFRSIQGLSSGGEIAAVAVYLAEKSPLTALGLSTGIVSLGGNMGFCLGAGSNVVIQVREREREKQRGDAQNGRV